MSGAALLSLSGLSKHFGGLKAVSDVSFDLASGDLVSIIGPNGAGKTTLFNLITGQLAANEGRILYKNEDITHLPTQKRAQLGLGRTFQISRTLTALSALENVMVGAFLHRRGVKEAWRHASHVLDMVGLGPRAGVRAGSLTLSERRRLEIARALALDCEVLLLDEVMAGLNHTEVDGVIALVRKLHGDGLTILVIEHNLKVVRTLESRVIVLDFGRKIAEGTPQEVLSNPDVVEAYVGRKRA